MYNLTSPLNGCMLSIPPLSPLFLVFSSERSGIAKQRDNMCMSWRIALKMCEMCK